MSGGSTTSLFNRDLGNGSNEWILEWIWARAHRIGRAVDAMRMRPRGTAGNVQK